MDTPLDTYGPSAASQSVGSHSKRHGRRQRGEKRFLHATKQKHNFSASYFWWRVKSGLNRFELLETSDARRSMDE